jgi:cytochrome c553
MRRAIVSLTVSCLLRLTILVAGASLSAARADEIDPRTQAYAQKLAITVCGTCHGVSGNNTQPKFPRLAGQGAGYLAAQLRAFRSQTRRDPDALSYMWGMASELDDATIAALGAYYAAQKPDSGNLGAAAEVAAGRDVYTKGIPAAGVPACSGCHGGDAHGLAEFPRLAGQHSQYVLKQLTSFQSNMRDVAIMHGVAQKLRLADMQAVALYLESQP